MQPSSSERIAVIDVIRAIALFGIVIAHSGMAYLAGPQPSPDFGIFTGADQFVDELVRVMATGKFFSIFSFLFGLSFAIQLQRAQQKGKGFSLRFIWRLAVLFLIGFVHNAFFSGDILVVYALLGLFLIPLRRVSPRVLVPISLLLIFNVPGITSALIKSYAPPPTAVEQQMGLERAKQFAITAKRQASIKQSGTIADVVRMNVTESLFQKVSFQIITGRLWITFGFFLLGMCAGKANLFQRSKEHETFFRRLAIASGIAALVTTVLTVLYPAAMILTSADHLAAYFVLCVQNVTLAAFFAACTTLLYWRQFAGGLLNGLAAMGKMGLTTYLSQTAIGLIIFYGFGFGLLGRTGVATCTAIGVGIYIAQIFAAQWWMRRFSQGPVEWLWRTLTYLKPQPIVQPKTTMA